jgi:two-component system, LytTR family, response regulator
MDILIVDHDAGVRAQIRTFCERTEDVRVVGEADTGIRGLQAARKLRPDLLLIAVKLLDTTGFNVLRALPSYTRRRSIMVTRDAVDAAAAVAAGALGCLVAPLSEEAFAALVLRARQPFPLHSASTGAAMRTATPVVVYQEAQRGQPMFLVGEREHRLYPLDPAQVDFVESAGNYVKYHVAQFNYIARESIKRLNLMLAPTGFIRIERSLLLNIRAIAYVQLVGHGTFSFTLTSGVRLHSGYAYRDAILSALPLRRRVPKQAKQPKTTRERVVELHPRRRAVAKVDAR